MRTLFRKIKKKIRTFNTLQKQKRVLPKFLKKHKENRILLISHQLTTTGSPLMLYNLAKELIKQGFNPLVISYKGGSLTKSFRKIGVEVVVGDIYRTNPEVLKDLASNFDKIIVNSIVCYPAVDVFKDAIWWIHEGKNIELIFMRDYPDLEAVLRKAENIFVVSEYAQKAINKFNPNSKIISLGVQDFNTSVSRKNKAVKFAIVGDICECKAQDVLIEAIKKLDKEYLKQSEFHFFCKKKGRRYRNTLEATKSLKNVFFDGWISSQDRKWVKFSEMDVFIVPSRDESCSLVALEACMLQKPIIVSENVGAKYMVIEGENGHVFPTENSDSLKEAIENMIKNKEKLLNMGKISREQYEKFATSEKHLEELQKLIDLCRR